MQKKGLLLIIFYFGAFILTAQNKVTVLQVPGINQICTINEKGVSVLPSGRLLTPAGNFIRITNDPFEWPFLRMVKKR
jgi:hypothetical protein